ncbi:4-(cytidine 5'-diphospho)-2-C-methyl-D-erythritol kinase [Acidipropionibacterium timonense]|uniref:4-(cytidine 5'-diphospho)-2-C-methyl-D-erythritol kinase n=1 Tax=Acidipropionibacterium timonense TaxID=2161818 RepID=UPI0010301179|nr:4-(cytidine 5'-diphospho)-2-C-methyl-D-erythritol kinase [Acidipropionibacterium timonense]
MTSFDEFWPPAPSTVTVRVAAKVNLALGAGPLAEDGYHPLATVFEAIGLHDVVTATDREDDLITITVTGADADLVPADGTNLAVRAAQLLRSSWGHPGLGADLRIDKTIPVAGGMAGGSADAAGALLACSVLWDLDTSPDDLHDVAARLGSDVPFCLTGGVALGRGHGDQLVPVISRGTHVWVLATSTVGLSTPAVYRRFDDLAVDGGDIVPTELISALARGRIDEVAGLLRNDLQAAAVDLRPELGEVLEVGVQAGALAAQVCGSGPTCAFLVADETTARTVAQGLAELDQVRTTRIARGPVAGAQLLPGSLPSGA